MIVCQCNKKYFITERGISMKRRIFALMLCCSLLVPSEAVFAAETEAEPTVAVEYQNDDVHVLTENLTRGSSKPSSNASVHDLSVNNYNYQLTDFGYQVFTDKWLVSKSGEMSVSLYDFETTKEYGTATKNQITFKLCDSSGVLVSSTKTVSGGSASVKWINIDPDKKYYVCFQVPTNGNRYSGNGSISQ